MLLRLLTPTPVLAMADLLNSARRRAERAPQGSLTVAASTEVLRHLAHRVRDWSVVADQCQHLPTTTLEATLLREIVSARHSRRKDVVLPEAVRRYAEWLEGEGHYEVGLDYVLACQIALPRMAPGHLGELIFLEGRFHRMLAHWELALAAFGRLEQVGRSHGLRSLELRAGLGRGMVARYRGNLPAALETFQAIVPAAHTPDLQPIQASAWNNVGLILELMWHPWMAARAYANAAALHADSQRLGSLGNLGTVLVQCGEHDLARVVLEWVLTRSQDMAVRTNAEIQLMAHGAATDNRTGFCSWVRKLEGRSMLPASRVDYLLQAAVGYRRFGLPKSRAYFTLALHLAGAHQLHEAEFRIERIQQEAHPPMLVADHERDPLRRDVLAVCA